MRYNLVPKSHRFKTDTEQPGDCWIPDWYNVEVITCGSPELRVKIIINGNII